MQELLKVTTIQSSLFWENVPKNLKNFEEKIKGINEETDIIVLPEMFTTGFSMNPARFAEGMDGESVAWMKRLSVQENALLIGSIIIVENGKYVNRLIAMQADGNFHYYDKKHLFGMAGEDEFYKAGKERVIFEYKGWRINPLICYDLRFPVWSRNQDDYDILIYVANWPEKRSFHWKLLLQARAIENQSYVVGVNRIGEDGNGYLHSGDTCIFNALGERLGRTEPNQERVETVELSMQKLLQTRKSLPFGMDSDNFIFV